MGEEKWAGVWRGGLRSLVSGDWRYDVLLIDTEVSEKAPSARFSVVRFQGGDPLDVFRHVAVRGAVPLASCGSDWASITRSPRCFERNRKSLKVLQETHVRL